MALIVKHAFTSPKLDGPDPTIIGPSYWNEDHVITGGGLMLAGQVIDYLGHTFPDYLLECYGQSVPAATYPVLFDALVTQLEVTFTLGTPGIVNWTSHDLPVNSKVRFRTTGVLPINVATGLALVANQDYFIIAAGYTANSFQIASTVGGTAINLSGTPSGTHTGINSQYGVSSDLTTFTIPDLRGRVTAGLDTMGGTPANRLTGQSGGVNGSVIGNVGGVETHTLTTAQLAAHTHLNDPPNPTVTITGITVTVDAGGAHNHAWSGTVAGTNVAAGAHNHAWSGTFSSGVTSNHTGHTHTVSGSTSNHTGHTHPDTFAISANTHSHGTTNTLGGGGSRDALTQFSGDPVSGLGDHTHSITGSVSTGGAHTHTLSGASAANNGAHTHTVTGTVAGNNVAAVDHNHTWSGTVAGTNVAAPTHTHTASATGTATSAQADYSTGSSGSGTAHNNVQPTLILRKLVFVG